MAQAQSNRKAVQTAAAFRERRKPDPVVACRALWSRSTSNVGAAVEPRGNTTSSHRPLSSYKRGHQATSFIEAGAQKLAEYEELDGEERGTFLDDDDGDEVEGMDAEDRTYVKPKKKRRPPAAGAGNTWPILRKVVLADAGESLLQSCGK